MRFFYYLLMMGVCTGFVTMPVRRVHRTNRCVMCSNEENKTRDFTRKEFFEMASGSLAFFGGWTLGIAGEVGMEYSKIQEKERRVNNTINTFRFNEQLKQLKGYGENEDVSDRVNKDFRFD